MCLPLYFKFVIIPSLQLLLRTVFTSVGFKTSRFHLKISNVNLNFPDLHQRHPRGHGLPEMSLRDRPRSFPLPNCCCLNIELEINAPSLKHFSNPPVSVSCLCDADDDHLRFSLGRYLRPVQGTHLCITVTRPSSLAPMNTLAHLPPLWIFAIAGPRPPGCPGRAVPVGPSWFAAANLVMEGRRPRDYLHIHSLLSLLCYVVTPTRQGNDLKRLMHCTMGRFPLDNCNSFMFLCTPSISHMLRWTLSLHIYCNFGILSLHEDED